MDHGLVRVGIFLFSLAWLVFGQGEIERDFKSGFQYYSRGRYRKALEKWLKVLERDPTNIELHYNLGNCYLRLGRVNKAREEYEIFLQNNPKDGEVLYNLGLCYELLGERTRASQCYFDAIVLLEGGKGVRDVKKKDYIVSKARQNFHRFIQNEKITNLDTWLIDDLKNDISVIESAVKLEKFLLYSGGYLKVIFILLLIIPFSCLLYLFWIKMGKSYFELEGEFAGKRGRYFYEYIKNLKTHTATDLEFHRELADLYFRENEYEKAIPEYQQVLLFSPQDLKSRVLLGEIYIIQGQLGQALFNYREAVKINPANKVIKRRLSELEEVIEEYTKNTKKKQT